jgi:hypothetical protein
MKAYDEPPRLKSERACLLVEALIDLCDLRDPALALCVLQRKDLFVRPMKVIGDVRYLLIEPL